MAAESKNTTTQTVVMGLYGISVITSGLWRFFSADGGHAGLWFGIVMGGLGILSAFLFRILADSDRSLIPAHSIAWTAIAFVGGWFCYEALIKKGFENAETRQLIIIGITFATAGWMLYSSRAGSSDSSADD